MTKSIYYDILAFVSENKFLKDEDGNNIRYYTDDEYIDMIQKEFDIDENSATFNYNNIMFELSKV